MDTNETVTSGPMPRRAPADREAGEMAAFQSLYDEHAVFVFRMLRRYGVPPAQLDDALQEVFIVVYRRAGDFGHRSSWRTWLVAIVRKVAAVHARAERRARRRQEVFQPPAGAVQPDRQVQAREDVAFVEAFLAGLPVALRETFTLSEIEGWTARQVAEALDVPLGTVYRRLHVARGRFAAAVEARRRGADRE